MSMQKSAIALAILALAATGTVNAAEPGSPTNTKVTGDIDSVVSYPTDASGSGYAYVQTSAENVTIGQIEFKNANPAGNYSVAYLKNHSQQVTVNKLITEKGSAQKRTIGNLEFRDGSKSGEPVKTQGFVVNQAVLSNDSALRVHTDSSSSKAVTSVTLKEVVMAGNSGMAFGGGGFLTSKLGAQSQAVETIWAGYVVDETGQLVSDTVADSVTGIALSTNSSAAPVKVGTINVGNTKFVTNSEAKTIAGSSSGLDASTLTALDGSDTITFNLHDKNAKLALGTIGTIASAQGTLADEPAVLPVNLDININVDNYAQPISIEAIQTGAAIDVQTVGSAEQTGAEVAQGIAENITINQVNGVTGEEQGEVTTTVAVGQAGLNDATETVFTLDKNGNIDADNGVTQVTGTNTVLASLTEVSSLGLMQWRAEMNHLQYRMGELRDHAGYNNGVWARAYQGKDEYGSQNVDNEYFGFQAGYDHRIEGTNVILGGAVNYTQGDSTFDTGDGDNYTLAFTGYGTWIADNGMFLDGTIKYGTLSNDVDMRAQDGDRWIDDTASYDTNAMSVSVEGGWRFPISNLWPMSSRRLR